MALGPTFSDEVFAAGLGGLPFAWMPSGEISGRENLTAEQNAALDAVIAAHDPAKPTRRLVPKTTVLSRLTDAQLDAALGAMTNRQKERWRAPDKPEVASDDQEVIGLLKAIGADPNTVLAP